MTRGILDTYKVCLGVRVKGRTSSQKALKQTNDLYLLASNFPTDTQIEFFFENPKLLILGKQIGLKILGAFGVFSAYLLAPIWVL